MMNISEEVGRITNILEDAVEEKDWDSVKKCVEDLDTLYNPTCPGYAEAYVAYLYNKACEADTLYDSGCPGYDTAYLNQQCNIDQLYSPSCPLYQVAYYNQQCELDSQYDMGCPNYIAPSTESDVVVTAPESVEEILAETNITSQPIAELNVTVVPDIPIIQPVIIPQPVVVEEIPVVSDISTEENASNSKAFNPHGASGRDNFLI